MFILMAVKVGYLECPAHLPPMLLSFTRPKTRPPTRNPLHAVLEKRGLWVLDREKQQDLM